MQISKSEYMMFLKHPLYIWLKKHDKSKLPAVTPALQAIFDTGHMFEAFAEKIFDNPTKLGFDSYQDYLSLPRRTQEAIANVSINASEKNKQTVLQARFESMVNKASVTCISDAIVFVDPNMIDLYEIKSGTRVKQENLYDLAFQKLVIEQSGIAIRDIYVINVNNAYVRSGDININELCTQTKVTNEVEELLEQTAHSIELANKCISSKTMPLLEVPDVDDGAEVINAWLELYSIFNPIKSGSIFELSWPKNRIAQLHGLGVANLVDIADDFELSTKQKLQVNSIKTKEQYIEVEPIKEFLDEFQYPLYFLDYETAMSVIPPFDNTSPYQQIPFQFSLHILDTPNGQLRHEMYLHKENNDSTYELSKYLQKHIGDSGSIVTWNASFEKGCNTLMGEIHPEFEKFYNDVNERIVDLAIPFQKNWYVDYRFLGSYSIKKVLPVLVPELSYKDLGINEGLSAQRNWMDAILEEKFTAKRRQQILDDLEKYCELDTLAMVEIYRFLKTQID